MTTDIRAGFRAWYPDRVRFPSRRSDHRTCLDRLPRRARTVALGAVLTFALAAIPVPRTYATILLFDQERNTVVDPASSGGRVPDDYGDNVTGAVMAVPGGFFTYDDAGEGFTPAVTVDIFSASATATDSRARLWQNGYGDLVNAVFAEGPGIGGSPTLSVLLSAAPGFVVDLYGFDLAGFPSADYTIAAVEVSAGAVTLFSASNVLVQGDLSGPRHTSFAFAAPVSAAQILILVDQSNLAPGIQDNIGIDSIRFGQTPPPASTIAEPATLLLLLGALLLATPTRSRSAIFRG